MASHPDSYGGRVIARQLRAPDLLRRAAVCEAELMEQVVEIAESLVADGAQAIVTSCGYWIKAQAMLSGRLPVPVFTSSLLFATMAMSTARMGKVLIGAAIAERFDVAHLREAGIRDEEFHRFTTVGMEDKPHFANMILAATGVTDVHSLRTEIADTVVATADADAGIGAIILECADMALAADEIRDRTGLPVWDAVQLGRLARSSLRALRVDVDG